MTAEKRWLRTALLVAGALAGLHVALSYALSALGLVESLLSPSGLRALSVLPLAALFYVARLLLLFVMPGLLVTALLLWALFSPPRSSKIRRVPPPGGAS